MTSQYPEQYDCGRVNLWVKDSKKGDKFLSGIVEFFQPDGTVVKLNIRAFKNNKKNERSADFFGSISVDVDGVAFVEFSEKVDVVDSEPVQPKRSSTPKPSKPSVQRSKVEDDNDPIF
jgi:hypothetical protein